MAATIPASTLGLRDQCGRVDVAVAGHVYPTHISQLWVQPTNITGMGRRLDAGCELAKATGLTPMKRFAAMLRRHRDGICNYAAHPITTARLEGGHVAIGLIRKRTRGLLDAHYFKPKIRQSAMPEPPLGLYALTG